MTFKVIQIFDTAGNHQKTSLVCFIQSSWTGWSTSSAAVILSLALLWATKTFQDVWTMEVVRMYQMLCRQGLPIRQLLAKSIEVTLLVGLEELACRVANPQKDLARWKTSNHQSHINVEHPPPPKIAKPFKAHPTARLASKAAAVAQGPSSSVPLLPNKKRSQKFTATWLQLVFFEQFKSLLGCLFGATWSASSFNQQL